MSSARVFTPRLTVAAAACLALLAIGASSASAAPATDDQGYVDSTARCTTPAIAVAFGSTDSSRVAICKTPSGQYEYRGVRVRDGAKLIVPASQSGDGGFVADNSGTTYTVTAKALVVSAGGKVIREEPMVDFHTSGTPAAPAAPPPTTTTPATPLPPPLRAEVGGGR
jgi:acyl-coenzyme A synthetase/AMP-(fatty) acid ligase